MHNRAKFSQEEDTVSQKITAKLSKYAPLFVMMGVTIAFTMINAMYWGGVL
ncbi:hypothetical protein LRP50_19560 [Enterovibrio sp. ZSDZ42]|uniref:Uncharacterized protein n=1 Tax=Enterovibrio gelatinilyticus TaxID=2899819 RepID=A0ABT5R504_9GAMM|nr:hypothetical protein [Enterovibrio sp. ZSDZ42]MDD1795333.1 hypothetical protein [Enterovibrio sp. ZSDZ42]